MFGTFHETNLNLDFQRKGINMANSREVEGGYKFDELLIKIFKIDSEAALNDNFNF